jgi:hypothetical protein
MELESAIQSRVMEKIVPNYSAFRKRNPLEPEKRPLRFFEIARVLVRFDHLASCIPNANDSVCCERAANFLTGKTSAQSEPAIIIFAARARAIRGNPANVVTHRVPSPTPPSSRWRCAVPRLARAARILGGTGERSGLQTRTAATESVSLCERMKS